MSERPSAADPQGRAPAWLTRYTGGVLVAFAAFTVGPSLIGLRTLISVNLLSQSLPWRANGLIAGGHQICTTDTIDGVMPGIAYARGQLFSGHLASWQSLVAGGSPLASVPSLGLLDPLSLPYYVMPLWLAPAFVVLGQLAASIGGTFLFLRRLGLSRPAGLLAGLIYATSGFMVVWTNWPQTRTAALIPWVFWGIERLIQRQRLTDAVIVALAVASMIFGGFPQVAGLGLYLAGAYLVVRLIARYRSRIREAVRPLWLAVLGAVLGFGVTMVQLLPFVSQLNSTNLSYRSSGLNGLPYPSLITLAVPNAYGSCVYGRPLQGVINPIELIAYIGAAALLLAIAGAASGITRPPAATRSVRGYFAGAVVVIIILGWVSVDARRLAVHLPVFADNFIGRIRVILGFCLAVLAGLGFDWMIRARGEDSGAADSGTPARRARLPRWAWPTTLWAAVIIVSGYGLWRAHRTYLAVHVALRHDSEMPALLGALALAALLASRMRARRIRTAALVVIPVLVAVQAASFFHTILPGDSPSEFYPVTAAHRFLKANLGHDRYAAAGGQMFPATSLYYGLRTPTGHAFTQTTWQQLLREVDPGVMGSATNSDFTANVTQNTIGASPILDRMGVKYFALPPDEIAGTVEPLPDPTGDLAVPATGSGSCSLPSSPLRGVTVRVAQSLTPASVNRGLTFLLTVTSGTTTIQSGRFVDGPITAGTDLPIALAGEDLPSGAALSVTVRVQGAAQQLHLATTGGVMACTPILPANDHLRLVQANPSGVIYQRLTALPRIRWAARSTVISDPAKRLATLAAGVAPDTAVFGAAVPAGSGQPATVSIRTDDGDLISANVAAQGNGYLVVADAMQQPGWSATVDGRKVALVDTDEALVSVPVTGGQHHVVFSYRSPGQLLGAAASLVSTLAIIGILVWERRRRRPEQRPAATTS